MIRLDPPVANAYVIFENLDTGELLVGKTDEYGMLRIKVPAGYYKIVVAKEGFEIYSTKTYITSDTNIVSVLRGLYMALEEHRTAVPIDHPDRSVTRAKLEYPTEDVDLLYLLHIGKAQFKTHEDFNINLLTKDAFADKAIRCQVVYSDAIDFVYWHLYARAGDSGVFHDREFKNNNYICDISIKRSTEDFRLLKTVNGAQTILATEAVDLYTLTAYDLVFCLTGSTLKGFRDDLASPKLTATDTDLASGIFGASFITGYSDDADISYYFSFINCVSSIPFLLAPLTKLPKPKAIVEVPVVGKGTLEDPFRPDFKKELVRVEKSSIPEKVWRAIRCNSKKEINRLAVTWGAFEFNPKESTTVVMIYGGNPYNSSRAIEKHVEYVKNSNLKAYKAPRDYKEAIVVYKRLRSEHREFTAGKDNFAYQSLGHEVLEAFSVADFYYGHLLEHKVGYKQLKRVPDWEIRRTLNIWRSRLERVNVLTEERDKHLRKIVEVIRKGW